MQARRHQLPPQLQGLWSDIPAWTATLLFMFQPVAQSVSPNHAHTVASQRLSPWDHLLFIQYLHLTAWCESSDVLAIYWRLLAY